MTEFSKLDKQSLALVASRLDQLIGGVTKIGVAYAGYKANRHWTGALTGLIALRLAEGGNLAGGAAGLGVLTAIGLAQIPPKPAIDHEKKTITDVSVVPSNPYLDWWLGLFNPVPKVPVFRP